MLYEYIRSLLIGNVIISYFLAMPNSNTTAAERELGGVIICNTAMKYHNEQKSILLI